MIDYNDRANSILSRLYDDFHKEIFQSSIELLETSIKTKFSNFATNIRELTREVFSSLAPDDEVKNCEWYSVKTTEGNSEITRIQRMMYAIKGGLADQFIEEELGIDINSVTSTFNRVIHRLNKYTHINEKVYYRDAIDGYEMVEKTLSAFDDFLRTIDNTRFIIVNSLEERLFEQVSDALTSDVIQEVDILATHYLVEGETINRINISSITSTNLIVQVQGSVDVEHQYGSDGDFKRGDGVRIESSYPFYISLILGVSDPFEISITSSNILVDNSSFFE